MNDDKLIKKLLILLNNAMTYMYCKGNMNDEDVACYIGSDRETVKAINGMDIEWLRNNTK